MAKKMNVPILGIVENMSYLECPDCGKHINVFGESHTEQVAEDQWERHMKTVDVDVPISVDLNPKSADIIGGHWLKSEKE